MNGQIYRQRGLILRTALAQLLSLCLQIIAGIILHVPLFADPNEMVYLSSYQPVINKSGSLLPTCPCLNLQIGETTFTGCQILKSDPACCSESNLHQAVRLLFGRMPFSLVKVPPYCHQTKLIYIQTQHTSLKASLCFQEEAGFQRKPRISSIGKSCTVLTTNQGS